MCFDQTQLVAKLLSPSAIHEPVVVSSTWYAHGCSVSVGPRTFTSTDSEVIVPAATPLGRL